MLEIEQDQQGAPITPWLMDMGGESEAKTKEIELEKKQGWREPSKPTGAVRKNEKDKKGPRTQN